MSLRCRSLNTLIGVIACSGLWSLCNAQQRQSPDDMNGSPEARAVAYLVREVPKWSRENKCYSCHNNGDAARALYTAARLGYAIPKEALADTTRWLEQPESWEHNGGEGPFNDKVVARLQFTSTLAAAVEAGFVKDRRTLMRALDRLAEDQTRDGSWPVQQARALGSPATYGRTLATSVGRNLLSTTGHDQFGTRVIEADRWLREQRVESVMDASATLLALGASREAQEVRKRCFETLRRGQSPQTGGWGPYVNSPDEVFDTALAVLALRTCTELPGANAMIARGREFLIANQGEDGRWAETTRPTGGESYAQRVSTAGWATLALLLTRDATPATNTKP
jgi:hypothetical protein